MCSRRPTGNSRPLELAFVGKLAAGTLPVVHTGAAGPAIVEARVAFVERAAVAFRRTARRIEVRLAGQRSVARQRAFRRSAVELAWRNPVPSFEVLRSKPVPVAPA